MATTLVRKNVLKNGGARYGLPGMRASAYFPPSMFVSEPPDSIEVEEPTHPVMGPDGQPLEHEGNVVVAGTVFATEHTQKPRAAGGTTGGVKVNAELQAAREEAKRLREQSKLVLKEAREKMKKQRRSGSGGNQPSLVDSGESAAV